MACWLTVGCLSQEVWLPTIMFLALRLSGLFSFQSLFHDYLTITLILKSILIYSFCNSKSSSQCLTWLFFYMTFCFDPLNYPLEKGLFRRIYWVLESIRLAGFICNKISKRVSREKFLPFNYILAFAWLIIMGF